MAGPESALAGALLLLSLLTPRNDCHDFFQDGKLGARPDCRSPQCLAAARSRERSDRRRAAAIGTQKSNVRRAILLSPLSPVLGGEGLGVRGSAGRERQPPHPQPPYNWRVLVGFWSEVLCGASVGSRSTQYSVLSTQSPFPPMRYGKHPEKPSGCKPPTPLPRVQGRGEKEISALGHYFSESR